MLGEWSEPSQCFTPLSLISHIPLLPITELRSQKGRLCNKKIIEKKNPENVLFGFFFKETAELFSHLLLLFSRRRKSTPC